MNGQQPGHLMDLSLSELSYLIQSQKVTPLQSVSACFERIHVLNPQLNALVYLCEEQAMQEARLQTEALAKGEHVGPLAGCPFAVKDLEDVKGLPTSYGCEYFAKNNRNIAQQDSVQVARLRKAGAIVVGKTNVPIFGSNAGCKNRAHGTTRNPWNLSKTSGGSSGGSASAVAARMLPFATAADGGGSIRIPAAFCGLFGLKPSFGRVPMTEGFQFGMQKFIHCVHFGCVTRNVLDSALHLDVVNGYDPHDPLSLPRSPISYTYSSRLPLSVGPAVHLPHRKGGCFCEQLETSSPAFASSSSSSASPLSSCCSSSACLKTHPPSPSPLKVGFSLSLGVSDVVEQDVQQLLQQALGVMETMGLGVNRNFDVRLPDLSLPWAKMMGVQEMHTVRPALSGHLSQVERAFTGAWPIMEKVTMEDVAETHRLLFQLNQQLEQVFQEVDILACPAMPYGAFSATSNTLPTRLSDGTDFESPLHPVSSMIPFNFSGHPACVLPIGLNASSLPIAIQLVAPRHRDDLLLQLAWHLERTISPLIPPTTPLKAQL